MVAIKTTKNPRKRRQRQRRFTIKRQRLRGGGNCASKGICGTNPPPDVQLMNDEQIEQALEDYGKIVSEINELLGHAENTNDVAEKAIAENNKEDSLKNAEDAAAAAQQAIVDARQVSEKITELLPKFPPLQYHNGRPEGRTPKYYEMLSLQEKAMQYEKEAKDELERARDAKFGSGTLPDAAGGRRRRRR